MKEAEALREWIEWHVDHGHIARKGLEMFDAICAAYERKATYWKDCYEQLNGEKLRLREMTYDARVSAQAMRDDIRHGAKKERERIVAFLMTRANGLSLLRSQKAKAQSDALRYAEQVIRTELDAQSESGNESK